jgi:hypothetical protein
MELLKNPFCRLNNFVRGLTPKWSFFSRVGNSHTLRELARWFVFVPILARLLAKIAREVTQVPRLSFLTHFALPFDWQLLYYAAFSFMLASLVYELRAPRLFRDFTNFFNFSRTQQGPLELVDYLLEVGRFNKGNKEEKRAVLDIISLADDPRKVIDIDSQLENAEDVEKIFQSAVFVDQDREMRRRVWGFCNRCRFSSRVLCFVLYTLGFSFLALSFFSDLHAVFDQSANTGLVNHLKEEVGLESPEKNKSDSAKETTLTNGIQRSKKVKQGG